MNKVYLVYKGRDGTEGFIRNIYANRDAARKREVPAYMTLEFQDKNANMEHYSGFSPNDKDKKTTWVKIVEWDVIT